MADQRPLIDGKPISDDVQVVHEAIMRRLSWPSLHWGVEGVHPDAWPHIAKAALDAAAPFIARQVGERIADAIEARYPEMGPNINVSDYRLGRYGGMSDAVNIAHRAALGQVVGSDE